MAEQLIAFFSSFPPQWAGVVTFLIAMTPVLEQRIALPVAIIGFNMPAWEAILITLAGNLLPVTALLYFADDFHAWVNKNSGTFFGKAWLKNLRGSGKFASYEKYGLWVWPYLWPCQFLVADLYRHYDCVFNGCAI
jgi:hypothetical protein